MRFAAAVFLILGFSAPLAMAEESESVYEQAYIPYTTIQPCDYWRYDFDSGNYVCGYSPYRINVVEAGDAERAAVARA